MYSTLLRYVGANIKVMTPELSSQASSVVASFARFSRARPHVIPAKAGIQYVRRSVPKVCGVDSRLRGNDVWPGTPVLLK